MFTTSFEQGVVDQLYQHGAHYFIRKPSEFKLFKNLIHQTLAMIAQDLPADNIGIIAQPAKEKFVLALAK